MLYFSVLNICLVLYLIYFYFLSVSCGTERLHLSPVYRLLVWHVQYSCVSNTTMKTFWHRPHWSLTTFQTLLSISVHICLFCSVYFLNPPFPPSVFLYLWPFTESSWMCPPPASSFLVTLSSLFFPHLTPCSHPLTHLNGLKMLLLFICIYSHFQVQTKVRKRRDVDLHRNELFKVASDDVINGLRCRKGNITHGNFMFVKSLTYLF